MQPRPVLHLVGAVLSADRRSWESGRSENGRRTWEAGHNITLTITLPTAVVDGEVMDVPSYVKVRVPNDHPLASASRGEVFSAWCSLRPVTDWVKNRPIESVLFMWVANADKVAAVRSLETLAGV